MMDQVNRLLSSKIFDFEHFTLSIEQILLAVLVVLFTKIFLWGINKFLIKKFATKKNKGAQHALFQLIKYLLWIASIVFILELIGIRITFLLAGSAALLVGVGLGLQQTFNDIISGLILLMEGSIHIDDIIEVDGKVVKVSQIGLRTSEVIDRNEITCILPNSRIVTDRVINWSHNNETTRFVIAVGVAYGSDPDLVSELLTQAALEHNDCIKTPEPTVLVKDFGDSSLNFELYFLSDELFRIELVKSDIRKLIIKKFQQNNIQIPFPQRDFHLINSNMNKK
jgi:small-conductance mechanosensitive channel